MPNHPATYSTPVVLLLATVSLGMLANLAMLLVTVKRKQTVYPTGDRRRDRIVAITINRAMRLEFFFFVCQFARLTHTFYEVHAPRGLDIYRTDMWAVGERFFVTVVLVVASAWDYRDRTRLAGYLDNLHPGTAPNPS